jgi:hypothetical protein
MPKHKNVLYQKEILNILDKVYIFSLKSFHLNSLQSFNIKKPESRKIILLKLQVYEIN